MEHSHAASSFVLHRKLLVETAVKRYESHYGQPQLLTFYTNKKKLISQLVAKMGVLTKKA